MTWAKGDLLLDLAGVEPSQDGLVNGQPALGSPLTWTTNDTQVNLYFDQNTYGEDYFAADFDMDCSQTEDGWFEFYALQTDGSKLSV